jgi:hypothetical protein
MATNMRVKTLKEAENNATLRLVKPKGQETMNSYAFYLQLPEPLQRQTFLIYTQPRGLGI